MGGKKDMTTQGFTVPDRWKWFTESRGQEQKRNVGLHRRGRTEIRAVHLAARQRGNEPLRVHDRSGALGAQNDRSRRRGQQRHDRV